MIVEERIISLIKTENRPLCDACIGKLMELGNIQNPTMARNTTAVLKHCNEFNKDKGECSECHKEKEVTRFIST
jgi:hypothetical protein